MDYRELIGKRIEAIPTPAMVVDIEALDHNLNLLASYFAARHVKLRPHFKSNKCVTMAKRQLAAGNATGITCAKLSEAEALVAGGVTDVLIANQVVGADKAARLAKLNQKATVRCAVDAESNVAELGIAAKKAGITIGVLVEVDIGMYRAGVAPGPGVVELAAVVAHTPGLRLDGLQGFEGHLVTTADPQERKIKVEQSIGQLVAMRRAVEAKGLPCPIVSGGGSGTYDITGNIEGIDEIQAGSYAMMDCNYKKVRPEFLCAMHILTTVVSSDAKHIVGDAGLKAMGNEFGFPVVPGEPEAKTRYVSEEHVVIDSISRPVGQKIKILPSHGCTTSNLHRRIWIVRKDRIEDVWSIEASGCIE